MSMKYSACVDQLLGRLALRGNQELKADLLKALERLGLLAYASYAQEAHTFGPKRDYGGTTLVYN
jgi:hypothetical protein